MNITNVDATTVQHWFSNKYWAYKISSLPWNQKTSTDRPSNKAE